MAQSRTKLPDDLIGQTLVIESTEPLKVLKTGGDGMAHVGAYAIRFSGPDQKDLHGEYFTAATDFGPRNGDGVATMFNHGVPLKDGLEYLALKTFAPVKTLKDDLGIFVETVLNLSDEYEAILADLVTLGKLKWSSGTSYHLARKSAEGHILRWHPIEFSYTPTPAESRLPAIQPLKSVEIDETLAQLFESSLEKAVWSGAYINDLPDGAFLYIEDGGKKDGEGKTTPRSLRHFPYKDASGNIDLPHLRNALARIPQSNLPQSVKDRVSAKAKRILDAQNKGTVIIEDETLTVNRRQMDTKAAEEKILELEATIAKTLDTNRSELAERDSKVAEIASQNAGLAEQVETLKKEKAAVSEELLKRIGEVNEMYALGYQFGNVTAAREFVAHGKNIAEFRTHLLDVLKAQPVIVDVAVNAADISKRLTEITDPSERTEFFRKNREAIYAANRQLKKQ